MINNRLKVKVLKIKDRYKLELIKNVLNHETI